jgi:hypothetical protein
MQPRLTRKNIHNMQPEKLAAIVLCIKANLAMPLGHAHCSLVSRLLVKGGAVLGLKKPNVE